MITLWGRNNSTNVKKVLWTLESWIYRSIKSWRHVVRREQRGRLSGHEPERPGAAAAR
jgi:hypothetical protein